MSLSATSRLTGSVCSAIQTVPMPPSPICSQQLVRPDQRAGAFDRQAGRSSRPAERRVFVKRAQLFVRLHEPLDPRLAARRRRRRPSRRSFARSPGVWLLDGFEEDRAGLVGRDTHASGSTHRAVLKDSATIVARFITRRQKMLQELATDGYDSAEPSSSPCSQARA